MCVCTSISRPICCCRAACPQCNRGAVWVALNQNQPCFLCHQPHGYQAIHIQNVRSSLLHTPREKKTTLCYVPNISWPLRIHLHRLTHVLRGVGTILLSLSEGFHAFLAIACIDMHTHLPRDPPLVCLQSAGLLGGIQIVLLRFLLALCAT